MNVLHVKASDEIISNTCCKGVDPELFLVLGLRGPKERVAGVRKPSSK